MPSPQGRNVGQFQLIDDISIIKGNHTLKFGENFRKNRVSDHGLSQAVIGSYLFTPLTDFANGTLNNGGFYFQSFPTIQVAHIRFYNLGLYAQDEWAAKPNLKLTFGVRMDRTANPTCVDTCFSNFTQPFLSPSFAGTADTPYNQIIKPGKHAYYNTDAAVFDPRIGAVWSPRGNGKTVLRGGFGLQHHGWKPCLHSRSRPRRATACQLLGNGHGESSLHRSQRKYPLL